MYRIEQTDCFEWLRRCPAHSLHAVCTDPPYGILEFTEKELAKMRRERINPQERGVFDKVKDLLE